MIDIHSHILPGIDDGPEQLKTSLSMAKITVRDGIHTIIATPHTDGIHVNNVSVKNAVDQFNSELHKNRISLTVLPGYEIPFHLVPDLAATHTMAGSIYVLVEFPHNHIPADATDMLYDLHAAGFVPVIAHPERNRSVILNPDILTEMVHAGAQVQITAASVTGELGPDTANCAHRLLQNGLTHYIATDSHSPTFRKPVLRKAVKTASRLIGAHNAEMLVTENPAKILQAKISPTASCVSTSN